MSIFDIFRKNKEINTPWSKYYQEDEMNIEIPNTSMYRQIQQSSMKYSDLYAYEYMGKKVKYKKFMEDIDKVSLCFKKLKIKKGDVVSICLPNIPECMTLIYALNKMGAIGSMIHPLSSEKEIKDSLISTNSKYLITIDMLTSNLSNIVYETNIKKVIYISASNSMGIIKKIGYNILNINKIKIPKDKNFISYRKFLKLSYDVVDTIDCNFGKNTPAIILHSGGTTGTPKNVVIQNRSFILLTLQEKVVLKKMNVGDSSLAIMPNFHGFGLGVCIHAQLIYGVKVIFVPRFDSRKFDELLNKTKPSFVVGVPTLFEALIKSNNVKNLDLSYLKYVVSGGDSLSKQLEDEVNEYLLNHNSSVKITQGYGLSEALSVVTLCHDEINKSGSIGIPIPGTDIKIIDISTRKEVKYGEIGEICVHSKALMMGYLNNEKETNEALQIHDDGHIWLHTSDLGYMDEDGFVYYSGRQKRMIITSGYNVYPSYIENIIESHPAVLQCTVVGVPHPYKHEVPKAFIVLKNGYHSIFVKSEIKEYCKNNLAKYMVPKEFVYRKKLPTTKLGKVDFEKLKSDIGKDDD